MVNLSLIGCGYWGPNLLRNFTQTEGCRVKSVAEIDEKRIDYIKKNYPYIATTKDYKDILNDSEIDGVIIALPAFLHYRIAKEVLQSKKHVFVEKPLSLTKEECIDLINEGKKQEKVLMVGHTFEYNPAVRKVKEYIDRGEIGEIYYIYSQRLNLGQVRNDINAMWNLAPHDISIILFWLNQEPIEVQAFGAVYLQTGIEDTVFMNLKFKDGKLVHIHVSWLDPHKIRKMTIVGSKKMVVYDDVSSDSKILIYDKGIDKAHIANSMGEYDDFGKFQLLQRSGDVLIPKLNFIEPLKIECSHFIECIKENKRPLTDGEDGLRVVKVLEAGEESLKKGGIPVKI